MAYSYNFSDFEKTALVIQARLKEQLGAIRTGRANPVILDNIKVDYYENKIPLKQIAAIAVEDAKTLRIQPWDPAGIPAIEKAIRASDLGLQPLVDKDGIRVVLPELTEERRKSLIKLVSDKTEEARISLRRERDEVWRDIQTKEKNKDITEDEKFRAKDDLQKIVDKTNKELGDAASRKEKEIMA